MPEKIILNEQRGIIEVSSYGIVTKQDIMNTVDAALKITRGKGINKVLVDTREQTAMPDSSEVVDIFSDFPDDFKVAMLVSEEQPTAKGVAFLETVAVNRFFNYRIFSSEEQALAWLNE